MNTFLTFVKSLQDRNVSYLKRIGNNLTMLGKLTIYNSFIMSNLNFCSLVWHFCGEVNSKTVEKIQEMALRFIYEDHFITCEKLLCKSKIPSLKIRRLRTVALEVYKIINKECPVYLQDSITINKKSSYSFRYQHKAVIHQVRTTHYGLESFNRFAGAKLWNELLKIFSKRNIFKSI